MQPRNSQEAFAQLQTLQANRRKPQDILRESEERLGIPTATQRQIGLRGAITNTENLIRNVDPSVAGRTSGSLVTEAQKQRLIAMEREPLADQFREQSRALEGETASLSELQRRAMQDAQLAISADDTAENATRGLYDALYRREQDEVARQERERAFRLQQEESKRAAASVPTPTFGGSTGTTMTPVDPIKQKAESDVRNLLTKDRGRIQREYEAIRKSAGFGNTYDKLKLQLIEFLDPTVKNFGRNSIPLGRSQPTTVSLNSRPSGGLSVALANPSMSLGVR